MSSWQVQSLGQLNTICSEQHLSCMHISALRPLANDSSEDSRWSATARPCYSKRISYNQSCTADHATSQLVSSSPGFVQIPHSKAAAHNCHAAAQAHSQAGSLPGLEQVPEPPAGAGQNTRGGCHADQHPGGRQQVRGPGCTQVNQGEVPSLLSLACGACA